MEIVEQIQQMLASFGIPTEKVPAAIEKIQNILSDQSLTQQQRSDTVAIFLANYGQENPVRYFLRKSRSKTYVNSSLVHVSPFPKVVKLN